VIYADHNATTPPLPAVVEAMRAALDSGWGNPGSRQHPVGRRALATLDAARHAAATLIAARDEEIVFTSGATEALNLAILGLGERLLASRPRLVTCATEHAAVLEPLRRLGEAGAEIVELPVDRHGRLDPEQLAAAIDARTGLVCLMLANNETGVIHDVAAAARLAHARGALLVCDATQAVGRIVVDVVELGVDALAWTSHKIYGPQGCGALWLRRGLGVSPQLHGGGQERGLRPGTPNLPGIAGFAAACDAARHDRAARHAHLATLGAQLEQLVLQQVPTAIMHGATAPRLPGTSMFSVPGLPQGWLASLAGVAAGGGAACSGGGASHVLLAMGADQDMARNSVRISLGIGNTASEVADIARALAYGVARLKATATAGG
jgi:cysteine desulfurase